MTTDKRTKKADRKALTAKAGGSATSASDRTYDAIVIGAGHNGMVNGAYLAKAGAVQAQPIIIRFSDS